MRPERNSRRLHGITHAKSRMYEFNVPDSLHFDIGTSDPSHLFPLVIGTLGEEASRIGNLEVGTQVVSPRIIPEDAFSLRFSAAFLHAYVASKFGGELAPELLLLGAAAYYLCDLAGSASVLLRETEQTGPSKDDWDRLLRWLLAANWSEAPQFANGAYSESQTSLATCVTAYFADGSRREEVVTACRALRRSAYSSGSERDLLYADVAVGIARKRLQNAARYVLPIYSQVPEQSWSTAFDKRTFMKELWPSQHVFGERGVLQGRSAVVQMPTSAGKTRAIELVLRSAFFSDRAKLAVVVAPFRALCSEITAFLRNAFRGENVVLNEISDAMLVDYSTLIGDLLGEDANVSQVDAAGQRQIIVVTPEKLLYVLRHSPELADSIGVVIYDEGHQFDTGQRGITYELLLTSLKRLIPKDRQVVLVSAVIKNGEGIGKWLIGDDVVVVDGQDLSMTDRAVAFASWNTALGQLQFVDPQNPDHFDYFVPRIIEAQSLQKKKKREKQRSFPDPDSKSVALYLGLKVVRNGSVAVFCGTKATACGIAEIVADVYDRGLNMPSPATVSDPTELKALSDLYAAHFGEAEAATLAARRGIFSHHGDTPHGIRLCVEYAMKEGLAKFVVCTSTLAQGVNLPIRYLIVSGTMQGNERIKVRDFHNLLGRAGRAGMHTEGTIIFSDPKLYDLRHGQRDSWRWDAATGLLDPSKTESTASSLLELLAPFTNDTKRVNLKLDIVALLGQLVITPEKAYQKLSRAAKKFEDHGFSEKNLHGQLTKRRRLLEALESYLMANRGTEPFDTFRSATEQLPTETLAYHLADDEQRTQLINVFKMLAEHIESRQPNMNIQAVFGRTLLGLVDSARIMTWVADNTQALTVAGGSDTALLGLLWPLITELLADTLGRYLPPPAVLPVVHSWIAGDTYAQIMAVWLSNGGAIRHGDKTRKTKMQDIVQLCESDIGYESTLIVAAVAEILGSLGIDGSTSCIESLGTLLKRLKYGIAHADEIALYELGFADRVVAQTLRPIIASAEGQTARRRLRNSESAVRDTLQRFPRYFSACLSSLL